MDQKSLKGAVIKEWIPNVENIGCFRPEGNVYWLNFLAEVSIAKIIAHLFNISEAQSIGLFDLAALTCFWFKDKSLKSARQVWLKKPRHSSLYIFDKEEERLQITLRQADLLGEHWAKQHKSKNNKHIHVCVGKIDKSSPILVQNPWVPNCHVSIANDPSVFVSTSKIF